MSGEKAENTAQAHVIWTRPKLNAILPSMPVFNKNGEIIRGMEGIHTQTVPKSEAEWKASKKAPGVDRGWRYHRVGGGLLGFRFDTPVMWRDMDRIGFEVRQEKAPGSAFVDKYIKASGELHKGTSIIVRNCAMLTRTTKMGCYSWNLPAGPPKFGGCCPGSVLGFDIDRMHLKESDAFDDPGMGGSSDRSVLAGIRRLKSAAAKEYLSSIPITEEEARRRFICNGCYAMKGSYGNPSIILVMQWRKIWLQQYALPSGTFKDAMVSAIQMARVVSRRQRARARSESDLAVIPHPDFFRIHDSGDFFDIAYLDAWMEIVRSIPDVNFWAPTRVWTNSAGAKMLEDAYSKGKFPKNLAIRPSGIFFDAPEPRVHGMSGGTSSNTVHLKVAGGDIHVNISDTGPESWGCPAYLPSIIGGGARAKVKGKKEMKDIVEPGAKIESNPAQKYPFAYKMFPVGRTKGLPKDGVFYDAIVDVEANQFVLDKKGRPVRANKTSLRKIKKEFPGKTFSVAKAQDYEAAGCCAIARDSKGEKECRVCWGVSSGDKDEEMKLNPVIYGKH